MATWEVCKLRSNADWDYDLPDRPDWRLEMHGNVHSR